MRAMRTAHSIQSMAIDRVRHERLAAKVSFDALRCKRTAEKARQSVAPDG